MKKMLVILGSLLVVLTFAVSGFSEAVKTRKIASKSDMDGKWSLVAPNGNIGEFTVSVLTISDNRSSSFRCVFSRRLNKSEGRVLYYSNHCNGAIYSNGEVVIAEQDDFPDTFFIGSLNENGQLKGTLYIEDEANARDEHNKYQIVLKK